MAEIKIYNDNLIPVAKTSEAFSAFIKKGLMKEYTLSFSVVNNSNARRYLVPGSVAEAKGQKFDMFSIKQSSGSTNKSDYLCNHVGYRLSNYKIPIGYSFVGTVEEIAQNILDVSVPVIKEDGTTKAKCNTAAEEFSIGTCYNAGTKSFSLGNTQEVTVRFAILAMVSLGIEINFDNFIIHFPLKCGTGLTKTFEFGIDLCDIDRTWDEGNGTSYAIKIANLQRLQENATKSGTYATLVLLNTAYPHGTSGYYEVTENGFWYRWNGSNWITDIFDTGDNCIIKDKFIGDTVYDRIIYYVECLDDPTQDAVLIGVFVPDAADQAIASDVKINNSVQQGEDYNNVSIDRVNGVMCVNGAGNARVIQNANKGFSVEQMINGEWTQVGGILEDGSFFAGKLSSKDCEVYGVIGQQGDGLGFTIRYSEDNSMVMGIYVDGSGLTRSFDIWSSWGSVVHSDQSNSFLRWSDPYNDGNYSQITLESDAISLIKNGSIVASW